MIDLAVAVQTGRLVVDEDTAPPLDDDAYTIPGMQPDPPEEGG